LKIRPFTLDKMESSAEPKKTEKRRHKMLKSEHLDRKIFGPLFFQKISGHPKVLYLDNETDIIYHLMLHCIPRFKFQKFMQHCKGSFGYYVTLREEGGQIFFTLFLNN